MTSEWGVGDLSIGDKPPSLGLGKAAVNSWIRRRKTSHSQALSYAQNRTYHSQTNTQAASCPPERYPYIKEQLDGAVCSALKRGNRDFLSLYRSSVEQHFFGELFYLVLGD